ncbi:hypothetical protein Vafri_1923 [Volvox africanus]|nr:hypothetical protein Vafri_1923 [Volvox africanus]
MLYDAMSYVDPETGRPRGYMRLASNPLLDSVLLTLDLGSDGWRPADRFVRMEAPALVEALATQGGLTGEDVVRRVIDAMPLASLDYFLIVRSGAPLAAAPAAGGASDTGAAAVAGTASTPPLSCAAVSDSLVAAAAAVAASSSSVTLSSNVTAVARDAATAIGRAHTAQPGLQPASTLQGESSPSPSPLPAKTSCNGGGSGGGAAAAAPAAAKSSCSGGSCGSSMDSGPGGCGSSIKGSLMAAAVAVLTAQDRCIPLAQRQQLLDELRGMPLYTLVSNHLTAAMSRGSVQPSQLSSEYLAEKVAMALLMQRQDAWPAVDRWRDPEAGHQWRALLGTSGYSVVEAEAAYLREQLQHIDEVLLSGDMGARCGEHLTRLDCAAHGH